MIFLRLLYLLLFRLFGQRKPSIYRHLSDTPDTPDSRTYIRYDRSTPSGPTSRSPLPRVPGLPRPLSVPTIDRRTFPALASIPTPSRVPRLPRSPRGQYTPRRPITSLDDLSDAALLGRYRRSVIKSTNSTKPPKPPKSSKSQSGAGRNESAYTKLCFFALHVCKVILIFPLCVVDFLFSFPFVLFVRLVFFFSLVKICVLRFVSCCFRVLLIL